MMTKREKRSQIISKARIEFSQNLNQMLEKKGKGSLKNSQLVREINQHYGKQIFYTEHFYNWRKGKCLPRWQKFKQLAQWLNCQTTDLLNLQLQSILQEE